MSVEGIYSYLIDSVVVFLSSWVLFLLAAYARAFSSGTRAQKG